MGTYKDSPRSVSFEDIIPTGFLTAYPRVLANIPFAKEVYAGFTKVAQRTGVELTERHLRHDLTDGIQLRYELINGLLAELGFEQILEIASGLSPRGIKLCSDDASIAYSELDLPGMAKLKTEALRESVGLPSNLTIYSGNALSMEDIDDSVEKFDTKKSIAVINEGLIGYLSYDEKKQFALNIRALLERFSGGYWATSDVVSRPPSTNDIAERDKLISRQLFSPDSFADEGEFTDFFTSLGFSVNMHTVPLEDDMLHLAAYNKAAVLSV